MKAKEAPEKIYVTLDEIDDLALDHRFDYPICTEYTRTDAFIDKAVEWLKNSSYGYLTEKWGEIDLDRETLAVDFANYMKGE